VFYRAGEHNASPLCSDASSRSAGPTAEFGWSGRAWLPPHAGASSRRCRALRRRDRARRGRGPLAPARGASDAPLRVPRVRRYEQQDGERNRHEPHEQCYYEKAFHGRVGGSFCSCSNTPAPRPRSAIWEAFWCSGRTRWSAARRQAAGAHSPRWRSAYGIVRSRIFTSSHGDQFVVYR
jgi:hypothetical protein